MADCEGISPAPRSSPDQPVTKCRRLEPMDLVAAADRHLGKEPPVGRAEKPRAGGQAQEHLE